MKNNINKPYLLGYLGSLTNSQIFSPIWPELGLIRAELGPNGEKIWFSRTRRSIT